MNFDHLPQERRWHDVQSEVSRAFTSLEKLKPEYRQLLGQIMLRVSAKLKQRRREEDRKNNQGLKELGVEKIVGLMKSQNKRRWYDQDRILHKVYKDLYVLEQNGNPLLSEAMGRAIEHIEHYIDYCTKNERPENNEEVAILISIVLYEGEPGGRQYLNSLFSRREVQDSLDSPEPGMRLEQAN